jgi:uncharacterized caspase-like protein
MRLPVSILLRTALTTLTLAVALIVPAFAEVRVALVIGNGAYQNVPWLPNPANDANDVGAALRRSGFDTVVATDLDRNGMDEATVKFARAARTADVAIFYYSGHALQFNGVNYLAPVDARLTDETDLRRMTRVDEVVSDLQQAKNLRILVLDSCRDNPLAEQLRRSIGATRALPLQRGLAKIDTPQGMIVAYATQAGQTAEDGKGRNSPYTSAFLKHIEEQDEIGTIFREVSEDVYEATRRTQLPELSLSLIGRFYLHGKRDATPSPVATAPADNAHSDFEAAERVDTPAAWDAFLKQHADGFYSTLAQERRSQALRRLSLTPSVDQHTPTTVPTDIRLIFEKYALLGEFAIDCSKPPALGNLHHFNTLLADGTVERAQFSGPTTRDWVVFLDRATELKSNEVFVSGKRDGKSADGVWHIDDKRLLQFEASLDGRKQISNGRLTQNGREMSWFTKCTAAPPVVVARNDPAPPPAALLNGVKPVFEKYRLLGTFAVDCSKPASPNNYHYVHRLMGNNVVQRERMSGPTTRDWVVFYDHASELKPNEVSLSGMQDTKSTEAVWRIEDRRMTLLETTIGGEKKISNGRLTQNGAQVFWFNRCDSDVAADGIDRTKCSKTEGHTYCMKWIDRSRGSATWVRVDRSNERDLPEGHQTSRSIIQSANDRAQAPAARAMNPLAMIASKGLAKSNSPTHSSHGL